MFNLLALKSGLDFACKKNGLEFDCRNFNEIELGVRYCYHGNKSFGKWKAKMKPSQSTLT